MISYSRHSYVNTALNLSGQEGRGDWLGISFVTVWRSFAKGLKGSSLETFWKRGKLSSGHSGVSVRIYWRSEQKINRRTAAGTVLAEIWVSFTKAPHLGDPLALFALVKLHICKGVLAPRSWNSPSAETQEFQFPRVLFSPSSSRSSPPPLPPNTYVEP